MEKIEPSVRPYKSLPWFVVVGSFLVFILTLNTWATVSSLPVLAKIGGWDWQPQTVAPLYFLITLPARFLPPAWQPLFLNLETALMASLTLGLLARSVMRLPHDRTREQREREHSEFSFLTIPTAWIPPVLAVLACGLQTSFWEHATAGTGEMLDLLLFAYVTRCLLEFRAEHQEKWVVRFAFAYGLGITNNWALIGFFPLFLGALFWIKKLELFNFRFLSKTILFGLLGLLGYLILPIANLFLSDANITFWETLKTVWRNQKVFFYDLPFTYDPSLRSRLLLMSLTSLLPLFIIGIRWPATFGDISAAGSALTNFMFRVIHIMFFLLCLVVSFDLWFSPRALGRDSVVNLNFLSFYYVAALSTGYFCGYLLLVFGKSRGKAWARPSRRFQIVNGLMVLMVFVLVLAAPIALAIRNFPLIREINGPLLRNFGLQMAKALPTTGAVVLSDDPLRLFLLHAALAREKLLGKNVLVDTTFLQQPAYHRFLRKHFPGLWPAIPGESASAFSGTIDQVALVQTLQNLTSQKPVYYLHPSFGYYFENHYLIPEGPIYRMIPYAPTQTFMPSLEASAIQKNQDYWSRLKRDVYPRLAKFHTQKISDLYILGVYYSRAANNWGVEMQKHQHLSEAAQWFQTAFDFNTNNVVAEINLRYNQSLQRGQPLPVQPNNAMEDRMRGYRSWQTMLTINGPFDEPVFCMDVGQIFSRGNLFRQALQQFHRAFLLGTNNLSARTLLAGGFIQFNQPEKALELVRETYSIKTIPPVDSTNRVELLRLEAWAHLTQNNFSQGENVLQDAWHKSNGDPNYANVLIQYYLTSQRLTNALRVLDEQLAIKADQPTALLNKGAFHIQLGEFKKAIPPLDRLLTLQPEHPAGLLNRAIAHLQGGDLDASRRDYETLEKVIPEKTHQIYFGLAEIAYRKKEYPDAIRHYKTYLKLAPPDSDEVKNVKARLAELQKTAGK